MAYEILQSQKVYEGVIFDVEQRKVRLPNGEEARRDVVTHNGAAAVVALADSGDLVLVRQHRQGADGPMLELPAGKLDPGEDPQKCAQRELAEETGYVAEGLRLLTKLHVAAAYCTEVIHLFFAGKTKPGPTNPDPDEFVTVETHSLMDALRMVQDGTITDAKTVAGVLYYAVFAGSLTS